MSEAITTPTADALNDSTLTITTTTAESITTPVSDSLVDTSLSIVGVVVYPSVYSSEPIRITNADALADTSLSITTAPPPTAPTKVFLPWWILLGLGILLLFKRKKKE